MKRDNQVFDLIEQEKQRQLHGIELIASENFVSDEVMQAMGSVLTNKYAEGYPGARYYGGCQVVDKVEQLAIDRVCELYGAEYANVSPTRAHRPTWQFSWPYSNPATPSWVLTWHTEATSRTVRPSTCPASSTRPSAIR